MCSKNGFLRILYHSQKTEWYLFFLYLKGFSGIKYPHKSVKTYADNGRGDLTRIVIDILKFGLNKGKYEIYKTFGEQ